MAKAVPAIMHDQGDAYYRCLLHLPADRLTAALADIAGKRNDWFAACLKDVPGLEYEEAPEIADELPQLVVPGAPVDALALAPIVPSVLWNRCIVDMGSGTREQNIYYDNCSGGGGGAQRGFWNCLITNTIKYRPVQGTRERFCVAMYLWYERAVIADVSREEHLAYSPLDVDVNGSLQAARMHDF